MSDDDSQEHSAGAAAPVTGAPSAANGTEWRPPESWPPPQAGPTGAWSQPGSTAPQWSAPATAGAQNGQPVGDDQPWAAPSWMPQPGFPPPGAFASAGWTPPPKPGLFPLRPLTFGTLLGTPFRVLRHNPRATVGGALLVELIATVASTVIVGLAAAFAVLRITTADQEDKSTLDLLTAGSIAVLIAAVLVTLVLSLIGSALVQGLTASEVARGALGEKLTLRGLWRATRGRRWRLIGWTVLLAAGVTASIALVTLAAVLSATAGSVVATVLFVVLAVMGLVVLWVWLGTKTALVPSVLVVEKIGVRAAIARSWRLTNRSFWRTFGTLALVAVICSVASGVITTPLQLIYFVLISVIDPTGALQGQAAITITVVYYALALIVGVLVRSITSVVEAAAATTVYLDLRMRREGLDADLRRVVDERAARAPGASAGRETDATQSPSDDPFATPTGAAVGDWRASMPQVAPSVSHGSTPGAPWGPR